jgi:hypothetical protein
VKAMSYVESLGTYVNKVEDLRGRVEDDVVEVVEELIEVSLEENFEDYYTKEDEVIWLREKLEDSEQVAKEQRKAIKEQIDRLKELDKKLDMLFDYIEDAKRLSREKVKDAIKNIDLNDISEELDFII